MRRAVLCVIVVAGCGRFGFGDRETPPDATCITAAFEDLDGDGWGGAALAIPPGTCAPADAVTRGGDCDDATSTINPGANDSCDGDRNCDGAWSVPVPEGCPTIQAVLDRALASSTPATVLLGPGTHVENLKFRGAPVSIVGAGAGITILQGTGTGPVVKFDAGEGPSTGLHRLTVTGGLCEPSGTVCYGGGIQILNASPTLTELEVTGNTSAGVTLPYGGGIAFETSSSTLIDVTVHDNTAGHYGGGIYARTANGLTFRRVTIARNSGVSYGGGMALYYSTVTLDNVIFAANDGYNGGALMVQGNPATLTNVTMAGNTCRTGCGLYVISGAVPTLTSTTISGGRAMTDAGAIFVDATSVVTASCSSFYDNGAAVFTGLADPTGTAGNIAADPMFVDAAAADALAWNLRLGASSALRDAGDPAVMDHDASRADIGAYGGPDAW